MAKNNRQELEKRLAKFLTRNFDLPERIEAFRKRKLHTLEIELTNACNLSCFYCYTNKVTPANLSLDKTKEIIEQAKDYGIKQIVWLGGEPTINPNWQEILTYSKRQGLSNELWSNGTSLNDNLDFVAENCDRLVLHLDSVDSHTFYSNQERNLPSNIQPQILQGLDNLIAGGYSPDRIRLNFVLSKRTMPHLEETMRYFYPKRVSSITLIPLFSTGKGTQTNPNLFLSPQELEEAFKLRAIVENKPERLLTGIAEYDKWYQMTTAYITASGEVSPYAGLDLSAGNIYQIGLKNILESSFDFLSFNKAVKDDGKTNNIKGICGNCENSGYCFGTRANSFFNSGTLVDSDKTC
ncbi:radical SAM protein, partial [Candidatus Woesearchaeota archaeon]|nr:radical SAM protein [Candidatus Woesearchaeota archaeon]